MLDSGRRREGDQGRRTASRAAGQALDVNKRIHLEYFNRFLSRVFSEDASSEWVLKGGTGLLARAPSTRSTRDIDLYRSGFTISEALSDLVRLSSIDLGDHFRFEYAGHTESIGTDAQPYTEGYQVKFTILIGAASKSTLQVDLAVGAGMPGEVVTTEPASALHLPRLATHPYRLYPVVDQIADKVCATLTEYRDRSSSREKDLVDLVVFATAQDIDGTTLRIAITTEARRRKMDPFDGFAVPSSWGRGYARLAKPVPYCANFANVDSAAVLVARLIDPALSGDADGRVWDHSELAWSASTDVRKAHWAP